MPLKHEEIRRRREALDLSQGRCAELAAEAGSKGFGGPNGKVRWFDVESGKITDPRLSTIEAMAAALQCDVAELISRGRQKRSRPSGSAGSKG